MKVVSLVLIAGFFTLSSFHDADGPGYIDNRFYVEDMSDVQDEAVILVDDTNVAGRPGPVGATVCPGTGALCLISLGPDKDGDPIYFATLKKPGGPNIGF